MVQSESQPRPAARPDARERPRLGRRALLAGGTIAAALGVAAMAILAAPARTARPAPPSPEQPGASQDAADATPTHTPMPAATPSEAPAAPTEPAPSTPTPDPKASQRTTFEAFLEPLATEARQRRLERRAADPAEYDRRIDPALNRDRVNFLLYGYGVTYETGGDGVVIGSHTVVSVHARRSTVDVVSLTHDLLAPEIERYQRARGKTIKGARIDGAYATGGFDLQRLVVEDATGLSVDFQLNMDEQFIRHLVDTSFGTIEVDNPLEFETQPFILDGVKHDGKRFPQGKVRLDGFETMRYMKALAVAYDRRIERNVRKHLVFRALLREVEAHCANPLWLVGAGALLAGELRSGRLLGDFQVDDLILRNLGGLVEIARTRVARGDSRGSAVPELGASLYVVHPMVGDGGVWWLWEEAMVNNPRILADLKSGAYPDDALEIPIHGDPDAADLAAGYWQSVRALVKKTLPHQTDSLPPG